MKGAEVRLALRVFLGLPLPTVAWHYSVSCPHYGSREESLVGIGNHFLASCPGGARPRTSLHHSVVKIIQYTRPTAYYLVQVEPTLAEFLSTSAAVSSSNEC